MSEINAPCYKCHDHHHDKLPGREESCSSNRIFMKAILEVFLRFQNSFIRSVLETSKMAFTQTLLKHYLQHHGTYDRTLAVPFWLSTLSFKNLFEDLIFSRACSVLSAEDLGIFIQNFRGIAQIVCRQDVQHMHTNRSDPQEDEGLTFSRPLFFKGIFGGSSR